MNVKKDLITNICDEIDFEPDTDVEMSINPSSSRIKKIALLYRVIIFFVIIKKYFVFMFAVRYNVTMYL